MSGEIDYAKQKLERINKALDEYEESKGLIKYKPHNEADRFINMKHSDMQKLTPDELGEAAILLAQFAYHIQRAFNEEVGRVNWAEDEVKRTIAGEVNQYQGSSYEERKLLAIKENEYARKLDYIRSYAKARADRLGYLSSRMEFLAKMFSDLRQTKKREYNNGQ
jgi:hypothetical protein